jgi:hypothetical protein
MRCVYIWKSSSERSGSTMVITESYATTRYFSPCFPTTLRVNNPSMSVVRWWTHVCGVFDPDGQSQVAWLVEGVSCGAGEGEGEGVP